MSKFTRKKIRHDDETRAKIQAALIIRRFMECVEGKVELSATQVTCGKALLDKVLPDLASTDMTIETDNIQYFVSDHPMTIEDYARLHAKGVVESTTGASIPADQLPN